MDGYVSPLVLPPVLPIRPSHRIAVMWFKVYRNVTKDMLTSTWKKTEQFGVRIVPRVDSVDDVGAASSERGGVGDLSRS